MKQAIRQRVLKSSLGMSLKLLSKEDRAKIFFIAFIQVFTSLLDLLGVILVGALGALSVQGIESHSAGNRVGMLLKILHVSKFSLKAQVGILGICAVLIFISKTLISMLYTRRTFIFLSLRAANISGDLISRFLGQNLIQVQRRSPQEILYVVSEGVKTILVSILATTMTMIADFAMLFVLTVGLFLIDPNLALVTLAIFSLVSLGIYKAMHERAHQYGKKLTALSIASNEKILEAIYSYRETTVRHRTHYYVQKIREMMEELAINSGELNFQPFVGKYVIETISILGSFMLAGFEFATQNAVHAVAILAVFMAASSRIAPAVLRIQQGFLNVKSASGSASSTFSLISDLEEINKTHEDLSSTDFNHDRFVPEVKLNSVSFQYPKNKSFCISEINLEVKSGSSIALVGPSGGGKTTIVDLILGLLQPDQGSVTISGVNPVNACSTWPGAIAYVPQNIFLSSGSVRENIGLGFDPNLLTDERVWKSLELAQLKPTVQALSDGLETRLGEQGARLSGGQRQRIGIARAMFTEPKLLVLDEATSALDGETEADFSSALSELKGKVTVIVVAHRLSTIRSLNNVVYVEGGKILASGTFDEVRQLIPNFDAQASLMGL